MGQAGQVGQLEQVGQVGQEEQAGGVGQVGWVGRAGQVGRAIRMCVLLASFVCAACATPEDPARAALRERLKQEASLTPEDLSRLRAEVSATIEDKAVLVRDNEGTHDLGGRRSEVFGMLTNPTGMFDEGLRTHDGSAYRILNAPAHSMTMEIEAVQRLWIDVDTFEPRRFEYAHAYPNPSDYTLELIVDR